MYNFWFSGIAYFYTSTRRSCIDGQVVGTITLVGCLLSGHKQIFHGVKESELDIMGDRLR